MASRWNRGAVGHIDVAARRLRPWPWLGGFAALVLAVPILVWAALVWTARAPPPPSAMLGRQAGVVLVAAALLALGVLATRGILGRRAFVAAVVALAFVDALWHLGNFNGAIPRRDVFPQTPVVRFLKSDASLFRVSSGPAFPGDQDASRRAVAVVLAFRSVAACALPRPSATASARLANSTVSHSQTVIVQAKTDGFTAAS